MWAFLTRLPDILQGIGLVTTIYLTVKLTIKTINLFKKA